MPDLPSELWLNVLSFVPDATQRTDLMAVNRCFYEHFMDKLYHTINLKLNAFGKPADWNRIKTLVNDPSYATRVRHLTMDLSAFNVLNHELAFEIPGHIRKVIKQRKWYSRLFKVLGTKSGKKSGVASVYPALEALVCRVSAVEHLDLYCEYASCDLAEVIPFFTTVWSTLVPTRISLNLPPDLFGAVLHGLPVQRPLVAESISITFAMLFMFRDPELPALPYASDAECAAAISRLINSAKQSLKSLQFKDWYGFKEFPSIVSQIDHISGLRSVDLRTRVPQFALVSNSYIEETTKAARAITPFLNRHNSNLQNLILNLVEGHIVKDTTMKGNCFYDLELHHLHTLEFNPLAPTIRPVAANPFLQNVTPPQLTTLAIKCCLLFESEIRLILGSHGRSHLLNLDVIMAEELTPRMFTYFAEKLPNLKSLRLSGPPGLEERLAVALVAAPISSWPLDTILICYEQAYNSSYEPVYLAMMALSVAVPSIRDFAHSRVTYETLVHADMYNYLRVRLEKLCPGNWLYSPHTRMPPPPLPVPLPGPYQSPVSSYGADSREPAPVGYESPFFASYSPLPTIKRRRK